MAPPSTSRKKGGKASRGRALRAVRRAEPVIVEGEKLLLGLRGPSSSDLVVDALRDLLALKKPGCVLLSRRKQKTRRTKNYSPVTCNAIAKYLI